MLKSDILDQNRRLLARRTGPAGKITSKIRLENVFARIYSRLRTCSSLLLEELYLQILDSSLVKGNQKRVSIEEDSIEYTI